MQEDSEEGSEDVENVISKQSKFVSIFSLRHEKTTFYSFALLDRLDYQRELYGLCGFLSYALILSG